mgnify:CR=1 FL=1
MATRVSPDSQASQARRLYTEELVKGLASLVQVALDGARGLLDKPAEHLTAQRRRDLMQGLMTGAQAWHRGIVAGLRQMLLHGGASTRHADLSPLPSGSADGMTLVSDDTIELEIVTSRLALAIMDRASWEFSDLRSRVAYLLGQTELDAHDMLRANVLARIVFEAWRGAGLTLDGWRELQPLLHEEFASLAAEAYHETNRWLVAQGVLAEVDLRPFIRRSRTHPAAPLGWQAGTGHGFLGRRDDGTGFGGAPPASAYAIGHGADSGEPPSFAHTGSGGLRSGTDRSNAQVGEETRLMTRSTPLARTREHSEAVLGRLNRLIGRHVPSFARSTLSPPLQRTGGRAISPALAQAIEVAEKGIRQRLEPGSERGGSPATAPVMLDELYKRKQALKKAAATPEERATIEIVALLFQSILTEDRIPASVRVWFARLQMPVLRVAMSEPDFFATIDHPARRLIDRMGACVMGFDSAANGAASNTGEALDREIKRVVQVVEAYPDTGRRVFQTVLTEFEKFLEHYFSSQNEATRKGVSLAQQVEQRETLAIQYTIELRKMLNEMPVQEGVREFLFHVWADVLAMTAVKDGIQSDATKVVKRTAADLIWSAGAKVSREERADVIRRLPPLLKALRDGMEQAGVPTLKQDEHLQKLNNSLAAAFTAKSAAIPQERLEELMVRLETLEELLPEAGELEIDESLVLDLSGHESSELEVVGEGGSVPTPAMMLWARELQVGSWFMLEFRGRNEAVQLAWHGLRRQLALFVSPQGRGTLFQRQRLAAFLQAGLIVPAQEEALTVRATRNALARLDEEPQRLLG